MEYKFQKVSNMNHTFRSAILPQRAFAGSLLLFAAYACSSQGSDFGKSGASGPGATGTGVGGSSGAATSGSETTTGGSTTSTGSGGDPTGGTGPGTGGSTTGAGGAAPT